jgi:hypothetical protein
VSGTTLVLARISLDLLVPSDPNLIFPVEDLAKVMLHLLSFSHLLNLLLQTLMLLQKTSFHLLKRIVTVADS